MNQANCCFQCRLYNANKTNKITHLFIQHVFSDHWQFWYWKKEAESKDKILLTVLCSIKSNTFGQCKFGMIIIFNSGLIKYLKMLSKERENMYERVCKRRFPLNVK